MPAPIIFPLQDRVIGGGHSPFTPPLALIQRLPVQTAINITAAAVPRPIPGTFDFSSGVLPAGVTLTRSSAANYLNASDVLTSAANAAARFDYLINGAYAAGSACLLIEPAATNIIASSEDFSAWSTARATVTTNAATAPDGNSTADLIVPDTSNSNHLSSKSTVGASITNGQPGCGSAFFKAAGQGYAFVKVSDNAGVGYTVVADLSAATITSSNSASSPSGTFSGVHNYGNGWYRVWCGFTVTSGSTMSMSVGASNTGAPGSYAAGAPIFTGDATNGVYAWGAQLEQGNSPTAYIPTAGGTASRSADAASFTIPSGVTSLLYTFDDASTQSISVSSGSYTIPTNLNRARISTIAMVGGLTQTIRAASVSASQTPSSSLVGQNAFARVVSATNAPALSLGAVKAFLRAISVSAASSPSLARVSAFLRTIAASAGNAASLVTGRVFARMLSASSSSSPALAKALTYARSLTSSVASTASLTRVAAYVRTISASAATTASLTRAETYLRSITASAASIVSVAVRRGLSRTISASGTTATTYTRVVTFARVISASGGSAATLAKTAAHQVAVTVGSASSATISRAQAYQRAISASAGSSVTLARTTAANLSIAAMAMSSAGLTRSASFVRALGAPSGSVAQIAVGAVHRRIVAAGAGIFTSLELARSSFCTIATSAGPAVAFASQTAFQRIVQVAQAATSSLVATASHQGPPAPSRVFVLAARLMDFTLSGILDNVLPARPMDFMLNARKMDYVLSERPAPVNLPNKLNTETFDYTFDFRKRIRTGDSIVGDPTIEVRTGSVSASIVSLTGTVVRFRLAGGEVGERCEVIVGVTTAEGTNPEEAAVVLIVG